MTESSAKTAAAYTQIAKTTLQLAHVSELLWLFHQVNLPLILLKGIALVGRVYPAVEQRPMQDIDVLVRRADFERAAALLQTHGYQFSNKASLWNEAFAREFMGNVAYSKAGVAFDVHWHPVTMSWFRATTAFDLDGLWSRAVPTEIAGAPALRLCPEDEVLHLCYHTPSTTAWRIRTASRHSEMAATSSTGPSWPNAPAPGGSAWRCGRR